MTTRPLPLNGFKVLDLTARPDFQNLHRNKRSLTLNLIITKYSSVK